MSFLGLYKGAGHTCVRLEGEHEHLHVVKGGREGGVISGH